jgi:tetratricopeptide (TPR) repeat protein
VNRPPDEAIPHILTLEGMEKLHLEPEEAFVLSRVNGLSSLREIGQILGYDTARVWKLLGRAAEAGLLGVSEKKQPAGPLKRSKGPSILDQLDEEDRDPDLSRIPRSKRNEIRLRHGNMVSQTHYEVLGVLPGASSELIKRKYLELVKELHPDRFFGQELGHYKAKLEGLFERITLAHDELLDAGRRSDYDRSLNGHKEEKGGKKEGKKEGPQIKGPPKDLLERMAAAKRYFEMGKNEEKAGNLLKAANFFQLACQYDPTVQEHVKSWERMKHHIHRRKADDLLSVAEDVLFRGDEDEALKLFEEAHRLDPRKKECYRELTMLYLKKGKLEAAKEMALRAVDFFPNDARVHAALGLIYKGTGDKKSAIRELRVALKLDDTQDSLAKILEELEGTKKSGPSHRN